MQNDELKSFVEILRIREVLATVYLWNETYLVITSRQQLGYLAPPELLSVQSYSSNERIKDLLYGAIEQTRRSKAIEVKEFRHNLPSEIGKFLTSHLSEVQKIYKTRKNTLVEQTASEYQDLIAWGEPNSAKILAMRESKPIKTIHSRLMNARKLGLIDSPGTGFRF